MDGCLFVGWLVDCFRWSQINKSDGGCLLAVKRAGNLEGTDRLQVPNSSCKRRASYTKYHTGTSSSYSSSKPPPKKILWYSTVCTVHV